MVRIMDKNFKNGFSLMEACVVMIIVAIFVAVMANVIPHKAKSKVASEAHGRFECYYEGGTLYQQMFTEGSTTGRQKAADAGGTSTSCSFVPPYYAKYMIIDAVGGGAGGGPAGGGSEGQFASTFFASVHAKYTATPGKGGLANNHGGDTVVMGNGVELMTANGGKALATLENTTVNDILTCVITEYAEGDEYNCNIYPTCEIKDGKIQVSFCRTREFYKTSQLTYKQFDDDGNLILDNPRYIVNDVYTEQKPDDNSVWIYHDISLWSDYSEETNPVYQFDWEPSVDDLWTPSLYTMELVMDTNAEGDGETPSNLARYIESMQYASKMKDAKVGTGGAKNAAGYDGGVLFLW